LEAMASGKPVIASQVGGLAFLVRDRETGYLIPVREPQSLAKSIQEIMSDCCRAEEMGQNAALIAKDYAWPRIADRLLTIFDEVLGKKHLQFV
jgi:D-inositol-3-phosphate glycosyltransferase